MTDDIHQYEIKCRVVYITTVTVEARSKEEAIEKFEALDWIDDRWPGAEIVDYVMIGEPRE